MEAQIEEAIRNDDLQLALHLQNYKDTLGLGGGAGAGGSASAGGAEGETARRTHLFGDDLTRLEFDWQNGVVSLGPSASSAGAGAPKQQASGSATAAADRGGEPKPKARADESAKQSAANVVAAKASAADQPAAAGGSEPDADAPRQRVVKQDELKYAR